MKRKHQSRRVIAYIVFVVFILLGGYVLNAMEIVDDPFDQIAFLSNWINGGEQQFAQAFEAQAVSTDFSLPSSGAADTGIDLSGSGETGNQFQLPAADELSTSSSDVVISFQRGDSDDFSADLHAEQNQIVWSAFGDVLYDFWFICAITAVFIVVQQLFKFSVKNIKRYWSSITTIRGEQSNVYS